MVQKCRIGRNQENNLVLNDRAANDFHAVITVNEDGLVLLEDLNTHYGTYVNGKRISKIQLFPGDEVQIGFARIDWLSFSGIANPINEIEIRPSFSVPIKKPIKKELESYKSSTDERVGNLYSGKASVDLADFVLKTESFADRIEREIQTSDIEEINQSHLPIESKEIDTNISPIPDQKIELPVEKKLHTEFEDQNLSVSLPNIENNHVEVSNESISKDELDLPKTSERIVKIEEPKPKVIIAKTPDFPIKRKSNNEFIQAIVVIVTTILLILVGWLIGSL